MKDENKTKAELIKELKISREELEKKTLNTIIKPIKIKDKYLSFTKNILDSSAVGIFILDSDFKVVWINNSTERYFGLQREKVIGKDKRNLIKKNIQHIFEDPDEFIRKVFATYDNNTYVENFECHVLPDGKRKERWLEHRSQPIKSGLYAGGRIEHYYDITERIQAEEQLTKSKLRYQKLFTESIVPIILIDSEDKNIVEVNPAGLRLTKYNREELIGKNVSKIIPENKKEAGGLMEKVKEQESLVQKNKTIITKFGENRIVQANYSYYFYKDKDLIQIIGIDITERKKAEEELTKYRKHLEELVKERTKELKETQQQLIRKEKLAVIGQLAGSMGHELRNPLGVIGNSIYYLNMKLKHPEEKVAKHLDILKREIKRSDDIVSNLLDFSRVQPPLLIKTDLNTLIKDTTAKIKIPKQVELKMKLDEKLLPIPLDSEKIKQVIHNMASNAIGAIPEQGRLEIETRKTGDFVEMVFRDTGEGIPQENLNKIFEPLFTTRAKGIGLGLAIMKNIIESHKGKIEVESKVGKGTAFTVKLPFINNKDEGDK
ncbi:MAG: PAS domain S-box protein [Candidatus Caldatribacteriota bacterium]|nr:PAS domain S-box protein [Candidatus Caldatribacteriota bacterium]